MKYLLQFSKGRKSATLRLLCFFFFGYRWSSQADASYVRIFFQLRNSQVSLQFTAMN